MDDRVQEVLKRHEKMKGGRGNWNSQWQEIADRVWPERGNFAMERTDGQKRGEKIFDSTPVHALPRFAAAMESLIVPMTQKWHSLRVSEDELNESANVKRWCESVRDHLFVLRYRPKARFQPNISGALREIGAFGNGVVFVDYDQKVRGFTYTNCELSTCWWTQRHTGEIDTFHREYKLRAAAVGRQFIDAGPLPEGLAGKIEKDPDQWLTVVHCVWPSDALSNLQGVYKRPFASWYVCLETKERLGEERGYDVMPYCVGRDDLASGESYGRGPGGRSLADIKQLNEMRKTIIRRAQKIVDPPLIAHEDGAMPAFSLRPGAINGGFMSADGKPLIAPLEVGGDIRIGLEEINDITGKINAAFCVDLFQILTDKGGQMTATEVMIRLQEKAQLIGPPAAKLQGDLIGSIIEVELAYLATNGAFGPHSPYAPPPELEGLETTPLYTAPVNQLMEMPGAVAINNWISALANVTAIDPNAADAIDTDGTAAVLANAFGVPQKAQRSPEEVQQRRQAKAAQANAQLAIQAAPQLAAAAKDAATAQATQATTGLPGTTLPIPQ
jgi:hypothetical protein